jgi:hypothetical protein
MKIILIMNNFFRNIYKTTLVLGLIFMYKILFCQLNPFIPHNRIEFRAALFSNDETEVISLTNFGHLLKWDIQSGRLIKRFGNSLYNKFDKVAINPIKEEILTVKDSTAHFWNAKNCELLYIIDLPIHSIESILYINNGTRVAFKNEYKIIVWDILENRFIREFKELHQIYNFCLNDDGTLILIDIGIDGQVLKSVKTGETLMSFKNSDGAKFSVEESMVITIDNKKLEFWDVKSKKNLYTFEDENLNDEIRDVLYSKNDDLYIIFSKYEIAFWDKKLQNKIKKFKPVNYCCFPTSININSKMNIISIYGYNFLNTTCISFNFEKNKFNYIDINIHSDRSSFSKSGNFLLSISWHSLIVANPQTGKIIQTFKFHTLPIDNFKFTINREAIEMKIGLSSDFIPFDLLKGKQLGTFSSISHENFDYIHLNSENSKTISINRLDTIYFPRINKAVIQDIKTKKILYKSPIKSEGAFSASYSPDGKFFIIAYPMTGVQIYYSYNYSIYRNFSDGFECPVYAIINNDNSLLLVIDGSFLLKIYNLNSGTLIYTRKFEDPITEARFCDKKSEIIVNTKYTTKNIIDINLDKIEELNTDFIYHLEKEIDVDSIIKISINRHFIIEPWGIVDTFYNGRQTEMWFPDGKGYCINSTVNKNTLDTLTKFSFNSVLIKTEIVNQGKDILMYNEQFVQVNNIENGRLIYKSEWENKKIFKLIVWREKNQFITLGYDRCVRFWNLKTGRELVAYYPLDENDWVLLNTSGFFDASERAMQKFYFEKNDGFVNLNDLKERYYLPGLWDLTMTGKIVKQLNYNEIFIEKLPSKNINLEHK